MGTFILGSVGPMDHLELKIGLLFMSRLMVIFTGLNYTHRLDS